MASHSLHLPLNLSIKTFFNTVSLPGLQTIAAGLPETFIWMLLIVSTSNMNFSITPSLLIQNLWSYSSHTHKLSSSLSHHHLLNSTSQRMPQISLPFSSYCNSLCSSFLFWSPITILSALLASSVALWRPGSILFEVSSFLRHKSFSSTPMFISLQWPSLGLFLAWVKIPFSGVSQFVLQLIE